mmetsp:Transcript_37085/g.56983  ORF Transcript_37085/g.56983 Transcript_37085/m.56983 type:complete len:302 (-) Transcript_37085:175-1080(-)
MSLNPSDPYPFAASDPSGKCIRTNGHGLLYEEFSCLYPTLGLTYAPFETSFDPVAIHDWMKVHYVLPAIVSITYLALVYGGKSYFATREPWDFVKPVLGYWNLFLSIFSFMCALRCWPHAYHNFTTYGKESFFCANPEIAFGSGSTGLWCFLFTVSKVFELFDTMFIVVRKKKLLFLHVFHHSVVLLVAWHSYITHEVAGVLAVSLNSTVHTFMYFYYYLNSINVKGVIPPQFITIIQLLQFVIGGAVILYEAYLFFNVPTCHIKWNHVVIALPLIFFFFYLFADFFYQRYVKRSSHKKTA